MNNSVDPQNLESIKIQGLLRVPREILDEVQKNEEVASSIRRNFLGSIQELKFETERLDRFVDSFLQKGASLLTLCSLISLLPFSLDESKLFFQYYIIWILPFLIFSIYTFFKLSRRGNTFITKFLTINQDAPGELIGLQVQTQARLDIWRTTYKAYKRSLLWSRLNSISIKIFLLSYIVNFYSFNLGLRINNTKSIIIIASLMLFGILLFCYDQCIHSWEKNFYSKRIFKFLNSSK